MEKGIIIKPNGYGSEIKNIKCAACGKMYSGKRGHRCEHQKKLK